MPSNKKLIITLHGIRTRGVWQKELSGLFSVNDFIHEPMDYGYMNIISFFINVLLKRKIKWFYKKYDSILIKYKDHLAQDSVNKKYPSIIAHSFGTFIVGYSMLMHREIKFDTIIFCGSILPEDFPWERLFLRNQLFQARNEYGMKDIWTKLCGKIIPYTGFSGSRGFHFNDQNFSQVAYEEFGHSDFFSERHVKDNWLPLLETKPQIIIIQHGRELKDLNEFEVIAKETTKIDDMVYGHIPEYKNVEPSLELAKKWIRIQPEIYTFCINEIEKKYIGYINAIMVKQECFDLILKEGIHDNEILEEHVSTLNEGETVSLIVLSIAIDPRYRKLGEGVMCTPASRLISGLFDKIEYLALYKKIKVQRFAAVGWTQDGIRICQDILGMKHVGNDEFSHPIFLLELARNSLGTKAKRFRQLMRIIHLYEKLEL